VPACATGEEVYSIAILVKEGLAGREASPNVQIFGTDIDENAVAFARSARYRKTTGMSPERLTRWFAEDGEDHCPIKTIREMCVFSTHSVVKDPPFSKLDLISCRNLLIYMDGDLQDRVLRTFHYALRPDGILFLGPAEGASRQSRLFRTLDKKHRIFQRHAADVTLPELSTPPASASRHSVYPARTFPGIDRVDRLAKRAADKYSPVHLVVDKHDQILRFSGGAVGHYLEPSAGAPSFDLFEILRKALRPMVRSALHEARARKASVTRDDVQLRIDGKTRPVTVVVEPIRDARNAGEGLFIVVFQHALNSGQSADRTGPAEAEIGSLRALQHELLTTRTQLQSTIDDLETANEEMKSAGEEYQSINEELQSSNEELETSKEEMQSINEELQTVNTELASKNNALTKLNDDLKNLLDSTRSRRSSSTTTCASRTSHRAWSIYCGCVRWITAVRSPTLPRH
jgi:two-component system, chemotaxis family, CheB/CheR fusion protein